MGLDLYSGSLAKLYARDYESPQARGARSLGMDFHTEFPEGFIVPSLKESKIRISQFLDDLEDQLAEVNPPFARWQDQTDTYLTEQLNAGCLRALQILCVCRYRSEFVRPRIDDQSRQIEELLTSLSMDEYLESGLATLECQLFVPGEFLAFLPTEGEVTGQLVLTSTAMLKQTLQQLDTDIWAGRADPQAWFERGASPSGKTYVMKKSILPWGKPKLVEIDDPRPEDCIKWDAEYAFGVFYRLLAFSEEHHLPILQDG